MTASLVGLDEATATAQGVYWLETRADQGGRTSLWRAGADGPCQEATPDHYVRSRVHEYGGGAYAARDGLVIFSEFTDGRLYLIRDGAEPAPLTPPGEVHYADLRLHPDRNLVLAVREDHRQPGEPENTVVALALDGSGPAYGQVLCTGADFYASPELSADGWLAWTEWHHPHMPWDSSQVRVGRLAGDHLTETATVAGAEGESAGHPRWAGRTLVLVSDRSGWWNLYGWSAGALRPLHPRPAEFAGPAWQFGHCPYAVVDERRLLCTWQDGLGHSTGLLDLDSGHLHRLDLPGSAEAVSVAGGRAAAVLTHRDRPADVALIDLDTGAAVAVRSAGEPFAGPDWVSTARPVSWPSEDGAVHGWYYPPTNPDARPPAGPPPLLTLSHGGPTGYSPPDYRLAVQFWTSRGIAVLDVNYGGSSGFGRAYRERLRGRWGIVDVRDCAAGAEAMVGQELADGIRLAIMGGSAGGYTTLRALTATTTFTAGISLFGVADLEALAAETHKFESRYLDQLVGPYPQAREVYRERSPIHHVDRLSAPILLLQGAEDRVVPLNQAELMAAAARAKGLPVALLVFAEEGHGFRRAASIRAAYEAQLAFLGQVFGFTPADELPPLPLG